MWLDELENLVRKLADRINQHRNTRKRSVGTTWLSA